MFSMLFFSRIVFHYKDTPHSIHSPAKGHLSCSHFLAIMNIADMNTGDQVFVWTYVFIFLGCIPSSVIAKSYVNSVFNFVKNCWNVLYSRCSILHSH